MLLLEASIKQPTAFSLGFPIGSPCSVWKVWTWSHVTENRFFSSNYLIQERWRISSPNYRLSLLKHFEWWSLNWLHCFCSVLFSLFTTIFRLKVTSQAQRPFSSESDKSGTEQFFPGPLRCDVMKRSTGPGRNKKNRAGFGTAQGSDLKKSNSRNRSHLAKYPPCSWESKSCIWEDLPQASDFSVLYLEGSWFKARYFSPPTLMQSCTFLLEIPHDDGDNQNLPVSSQSV